MYILKKRKIKEKKNNVKSYEGLNNCPVMRRKRRRRKGKRGRRRRKRGKDEEREIRLI